MLSFEPGLCLETFRDQIFIISVSVAVSWVEVSVSVSWVEVSVSVSWVEVSLTSLLLARSSVLQSHSRHPPNHAIFRSHKPLHIIHFHRPSFATIHIVQAPSVNTL